MLLTVALVGFAGCSGGGTSDSGFGPGGPVPVLVAKAVRKTVAQRFHAIGRVEAYSTVQVKPRVGGEVTKVHFQQGQDVKKGELLFTIDPRPFEAALKLAQADLGRDRAQLVQAEADYKRASVLLKREVGSQQQYDDARAKFEALKATVEADRAAVENAALNLSYTQIRAPFDGRAGSLLVHEGNVVKENPDNPLVVLNQIKPIYVDFALPEKELSAVRQSQGTGPPLAVEATVPGTSPQTEQGRLTFIDNAVDTTSGTIELKGLFENQDERLWPGQFVDVTLTVSEEPNLVVVPSQAVQTGQEGSYVFVVDRTLKAEIRKVVAGASVDGETVIERGLEQGETVVTDGQLRLVPGAAVQIKRELDSRQSS